MKDLEGWPFKPPNGFIPLGEGGPGSGPGIPN